MGLGLDVTIKVSLLDHKNEKFKFSKTLFKNTFLVIQRFLSLHSTLEAVLSGRPPQKLYRSSINAVIKKSRLSKTKLKGCFSGDTLTEFGSRKIMTKTLSFDAFLSMIHMEFVK